MMRKTADVNIPHRLAIIVVAVIGLFGGLCLNTAQAQQPPARGNLPHLASLMNESMQVHHTKLWLAGHSNNWELAAYELAKIKETVEEVKETIVEIQAASRQWQRVPIGEMLRTFDISLSSVSESIKASDGSKFETAYRNLTATCNACHASAGQPEIKIIVPAGSGNGAFLDQDFSSDEKK
jgi:uncharacterized protein (DUF305 family)